MWFPYMTGDIVSDEWRVFTISFLKVYSHFVHFYLAFLSPVLRTVLGSVG